MYSFEALRIGLIPKGPKGSVSGDYKKGWTRLRTFGPPWRVAYEVAPLPFPPGPGCAYDPGAKFRNNCANRIGARCKSSRLPFPM
jgi:hypothetical protein